MKKTERLFEIKQSMQREAEAGIRGSELAGILLCFEYLFVKIFTR